MRISAVVLCLCLCLCAVPPAHAQSVASLFTSLPADFGHLFTPTNGIIAGVGGAGSAAIHPKDDEIAEDVFESSGGRHDFFRAGATVGDGVEQGALALAVYAAGRLSHHTAVGVAGADLIDAQIVNGVLTQGIKVATERRRPSGGPHSFPSGHTSATFATAEVLREHFGWRWGVPAYAVGAYVSMSRMVDNKHWASDVVFGAAIGLISGRAASKGHVSRAVSVSPAFLPGGVAIVGVVRR